MSRAGRPTTDLLVVGGGPAGLAAAIAVQQTGLKTAVIDSAAPPIDKACGEGIMPDGVACLEKLGVHIAPGTSAPFGGIRYVDGEITAEGRFPGRPGHGVRRTVLHTALVRRAEEVGVRLLWNATATDLAVLDSAGAGSGTARVEVASTQGVLRSRWLVGADGLHSRVRDWAGLSGGAGRHRRFGVCRHFGAAPWADVVEVHWSDTAEAYVTPLAADQVGVALLWNGGGGFARVMGCFPTLASRLTGIPAISRDRGAGPLHQKVTGVVAGPVALVGDAAGYLDALTGEGISLALHQALALAQALGRDDLPSYARAHRQLSRVANRITGRLLAIKKVRPLRRRLLRVLAAEPEIFSSFLATLSRQAPGQASLPVPQSSATLRLVWKMALSRALVAGS